MCSSHKFLLVKCELGFEYTCLVLYHCYKHSLVIFFSVTADFLSLQWAFLGLFPYPPPPIGCLLLHCPVENFFPVIFITFLRSVSSLEFSRLPCMECWGTRGFFYFLVFMQTLERNFQSKSVKAMQDLKLLTDQADLPISKRAAMLQRRATCEDCYVLCHLSSISYCVLLFLKYW